MKKLRDTADRMNRSSRSFEDLCANVFIKMRLDLGSDHLEAVFCVPGDVVIEFEICS